MLEEQQDVNVEATGLEEASPSETTDELTALDAEANATDTDAGDTGDTDADAEGDETEQRGPIPYGRFKEVNEAKRKRDEALAAKGLRFDEESGEILPVDTAEQTPETAPEDDLWADEGEQPQRPDQQAQGLDPVRVIHAVANANLADIKNSSAVAELLAEQGYDTAEWGADEWLDFKQNCKDQSRTLQQQAVQAQQAEVQARQQIAEYRQKLNTDPKYAPEVKAAIEADLKEARKQGRTAAEVAWALPLVEAVAIRDNLDAIVEARVAARLQEQQAGNAQRERRVQTQTPAAGGVETPRERLPELTDDERRTARMFYPNDPAAEQKWAAQKARLAGV